MKPIRTFTVTPSLPAPLERLRDLAHNLRWSWDYDTVELFRRLDADLWAETGHNPVLMLGVIDQAKLDAAAADDAFLRHLDGVWQSLESYLAGESTWFQREHGASENFRVAYFSPEYGLTECLPIYAGGLAVLAGDHLKSASDLGLPLVGVGLLYQEGYFRQYLDDSGWQRESYEHNDFHNLPVSLEREPDGSPLTVAVPFPGRQVIAQVWQAQVGRVPLYLLDTNVLRNAPQDRDITDQLYGGGLEMRIRQEIVLGIGGYRALEALGVAPTIYHMNEGHSAFLALEHTSRLMEEHGLSFAEAREAASAGISFTTHTPVPAGHDYFPPDLMERYFADYVGRLGISWQAFLALGRENSSQGADPFCMTLLALRLAAQSNAVSRLHGEVTRRMWQGLWPGVPADEIPIGHVTNGVHFASWVAHDLKDLYDRYLGTAWRYEPSNGEVWQRIERVPDEELWRTHERRRERLVAFVRRRFRAQVEGRGASRTESAVADEVLDPEALTVGFARRFATYKRATLLLRDPDRLAEILNDPQRPVQVIFAGKAHPHDQGAKKLIQRITQLAREERFRHRLVFVEDYDMVVARYMMQGVDVWLNTPRRPREASGTSGMKAVANGVLHLSTLDGWWDEAWLQAEEDTTPIGWAIGRGETYEDPDEQDRLEAEALYRTLERAVTPCFYDIGVDGLPRSWIARMKASIASLCHTFNTHRMVQEYAEDAYLPPAARWRELAADDMARAKELARWKERVRESWSQVRVEAVDTGPLTDFQVGDEVRAQARVHLGALSPDDVNVEFCVGRTDASGALQGARSVPMQSVGAEEGGLFLFGASVVPLWESGLFGYTVRVLPRHESLNTSFLPGLITWAEPGAREE